MKKCVFCEIANKKIKTDILYQTRDWFVIKDIKPKAKIHYLVIPKKHIDLSSNCNKDLISLPDAFKLIKKIAKKENLKNGYRLIINNGKDSGQEINHLHIHFLAGNKL